MIELDLSGQTLSVAKSDLEWLRTEVAKSAGMSSAANELAGRIAGMSAGQRQLVFVRREVRALATLLGPVGDLPPGLVPLDQLLRQTF